MANGKVCTGFSKPYVGEYGNNGSTVTYKNAMPLARGVSVSIQPSDSGDAENFHADNTLAESEAGDTFIGGTITLTVDGLKKAAETMLMGLPTTSDGWLKYGDDQKRPYVGVGYITRYMEDGKVTYTPTIIRKTKFNNIGSSNATGANKPNFQTQELSGNIVRSDDENHTWKWVSTEEYATEAAAETALRTALGLTGK